MKLEPVRVFSCKHPLRINVRIFKNLRHSNQVKNYLKRYCCLIMKHFVLHMALKSVYHDSESTVVSNLKKVDSYVLVPHTLLHGSYCAFIF